MTSPSRDEALGEVLADLVLASHDLHPDALAGAAAHAAERLGGRGAAVLVVDLAQLVLSPLGSAEVGPQPVDGSPAGDAFRSESPVVVPDACGVRLWMPLMDSAERVGVFGVVFDHLDGGLDDMCRRRWQAIASLLGELVVAKSPHGDSLILARRTRETSLAAELRWAMLPPLSFASPVVSVSAILEPAYDIAGDTFDYAADGSRLHLAILDAMGHGLEASRMANLAVTSYRHSRRAGMDLDAMVRAMDEVIDDQFGPGKFVTGQLATLDTDTGVFRMLNMGHPLPLLLREGAVHGPLECRPGAPVGLGWSSASTAEVQLRPGDMVLLHTDGITEARAGGDEYGHDRFEALVLDLLAAGERPAELLRQVVRDVLAFQGGRPRDDATLLLAAWRVDDPHMGAERRGVRELTTGTQRR